MRQGYIRISEGGVEKAAHVRIVEAILGKPLPAGAEVHHVNGDRADNRPENLVVCPDRAYHKMLHRRQAALKAGYPPDWLLCRQCKQYDSPDRMKFWARGGKRTDVQWRHPAALCAKPQRWADRR